MKTRAQILKIATAQPRPPLALLLRGIGDPVRWRILGELSAGDPMILKKAVGELAERGK